MIAPLIFLASAWQRLASTPTAYILIWTGLVAVAVACIVLYRTSWGQAQTLRKCAVLSLFVHVLFAGLAMTVKFVVSEGDGAGGGGPIRIRIVDGGGTPDESVLAARGPFVEREPAQQEVVETPLIETVLLPDSFDGHKLESTSAAAMPTPVEPSPTPKEVAATTVEPTVTQIKPDETPVLLETTADVTTESPNARSSAAVAAAAPLANFRPAETSTVAEPSTQRSSAMPPAAAAAGVVGVPGASPAPGDPYAGRTAGDRIGLIEVQGGSRETEAAVVRALNWLAVAQSNDGRWDPARHGAGVERKILGEDRRGAGRNADTGITALALLSFLGAGHTHVAGDYQANVERGLAFLLRSQAADGSLFGPADLYSQMYCHSMATFALAEAQAMTSDVRLSAGVSKAIAFSVRAQDPNSGGWRYRPLDQGDTSQLGWQVMALASGERAGLTMPLATWTGVDRFLRSVRRGTAGGLASYRPGSLPSTSMTAEALYCRLVLADQTGVSVDERSAAEATRQVLTDLPSAQRMNLYYWYYATLALHHRHKANDEAAAAWRTWNEALVSVLTAGQETNGSAAGSWTPDTLWGGYGGRVYSTALSAMCLEAYYRYTPQTRPRQPEMVTRPGMQAPVR